MFTRSELIERIALQKVELTDKEGIEICTRILSSKSNQYLIDMCAKYHFKVELIGSYFIFKN